MKAERKITDVEREFMAGVTRLALELKMTPRAAIPLFGTLTRLVVKAEMHQHETDQGTATKEAFDLFLSGFGGRIVALPDLPDDKELH